MSHNLARRQEFSPTCPQGGKWYACGNGTTFVGCCQSEQSPCDVRCSDGALKPAAYDPEFYGKFPDASCEAGSLFYKCGDKAGDKTFMGCCKIGTNPCADPINRCPAGYLTPAFLGSPDQISAYSASPANSTPSSTTSSAPSATSTAQKEQQTPVAAIAGGAVGGAFALALIIGLLIWYFCHVKRSRQKQAEPMSQAHSGFPDTAASKLHQSTPQDTPYCTFERYHIPKPGISDARDLAPPPGYTSPNPNTSGNHNREYYAHHPQNSPQELPTDPHTPLPVSHGHSRGISELSGDSVLSELESPDSQKHGMSMRPAPEQRFNAVSTGRPRPAIFIQEPSPVSPPSNAEPYSHGAHQTHGLGLRGLSHGDDIERAER